MEESGQNGRAMARGKRLRRMVEQGGGADEWRCKPDLWRRVGGTTAMGRAMTSQERLHSKRGGNGKFGETFFPMGTYVPGSFCTDGVNARTAVLINITASPNVHYE